ncbi:UDP-N-acetylmuramoyl-L-alanyl-D-glutamate--2,6-diaminopimelate ligase [soil metagenome]
MVVRQLPRIAVSTDPMVTERRLSHLVALLAARGRLRDDSRLHDADAADDPAIDRVAYDSRRVGPGGLFVALRGRESDGHAHAGEAVSRGAVAVLCETFIPDLDVPQIRVDEGRGALALAAAWQAGFPSRDLGVVGITGTDGKTTTAYLVRAILEATQGRCGLVGTIDIVVGGRSLGNPARATTPEAPELQGYLAGMRDAGDRWAVVESTSHGLAQQRVGEVAYDVAVHTNVTSEHLEFHATLEAYVAAKESLFRRLAVSEGNPEKGLGKHAVVNADDPQAARFERVARVAGARVLRYGVALDSTGATPPDLAARGIEEGPAGLRFRARVGRWEGRVVLRLAGRFNVHNALAALGVADALGIDPGAAAAALAAVGSVPGRMQRVDLGQPFSVVIDYAHTADSLAKVLDELRPREGSAGGLIAVFGSAGERDTQKRAPMGRVAGERCQLVVVTHEDPRREDGWGILEAIASGAEQAGKVRGQDLLVIPDRFEAIGTAISRARPGDVVLLAGKGHERSIEMAHGPQPWDEDAAVRSALRAAGFGGDDAGVWQGT